MQSIQETMSGLTDASAFETFDRMAQQIDQMEAEAEAGAEMAEQYTGDILKHRFSELEATAGADLELEALKRKMGLLPAEAPPVSARVAASEEQYEEEELAELEEALEELKRRER
jgi:phage shock protein A